MDTAILRRPVDVTHPPDGEVAISASREELEKLAAAYDLVAAKSLAATATVEPGARGSVIVSGRVIADVVQNCVVSLVPVEQHIDETFTLRFVRPQDAPPAPRPGAELLVDPDRPEPPEILQGQSIDLGEIVEEAFVLGIDPYPRAPGAVLPAEAAGADVDSGSSPFAVLAGLTGRQPKDG
jgi:uncharacterized metal-binding protein YceD (DUF177 family)